jgi:hypothetical protein
VTPTDDPIAARTKMRLSLGNQTVHPENETEQKVSNPKSKNQ